jgi:hypothetical protein
MADFQGCKLHFAASVSWHHKSRLIFYNDEKDPSETQVKRSPKPRQTMYEKPKDFEARVQRWKAELPQDPKVKSKGNSMTMAYYTDKLLPIYLKYLNKAKAEGRRAILQEDGDPSHGIKGDTKNVARSFKLKHGIELLVHSAQSPDLNPQEPVWNILKQRVRLYKWTFKKQLKQVIEQVWNDISTEEIQARISEMPDRCKRLANNDGKGMKSAPW